MRIREQVNQVWSLAREGSVEGERLRRRIGAIGALSLLVCGFLASIGLAVVVLAFLGGLLVSAGLLAVVAVWPELHARARLAGIGRTLRGRLSRTSGHLRARGRAGRAAAVPLWKRAQGSSGTALARARSRAATTGHSLAQTGRATAIRFAPRPARLEPQRDAMRLNAAGAQHRRQGRYDEAVECHRQALEIMRGLGDARAVALTQSNLALALSHGGDDEWAVGLLEEAAATLRNLGDEEHEAQIMANLGLTHRRHGRREEGDNVLELALAKLSPESNAYHTIEAELRRAS
jgi:tetratricopeptide (TPR) repeat protein